MQEIQTALLQLEEKIAGLESALHVMKKRNASQESRIAELNAVIRTTYDKIDALITTADAPTDAQKEG